MLYIAREEDAERGETEAMLCMLGRLAAAEDADTTVRTIGEAVGRARFGEEWSRNREIRARGLRHKYTRDSIPLIFTRTFNVSFNLNLSLLSSLICPVAYPPLFVFPLLEGLADVPQGTSLRAPCLCPLHQLVDQ
jgi:hypothetical protein